MFGGAFMHIKDLEVFQTVAEEGTITKAAEKLNYVQSNITSRIKKLEQTLNTPLFNRHRRGMNLTPEGKKLLTYSEKILYLSTEMKKGLQSKEEPSGKLEIGSVETVIQLPYILNMYNNQYTNVDLSLYTGVTEKIRQDVLNHKLDGAFVIETDHHPDLVAHHVVEEELVLISDRKTSSWDDLKKAPFLCFSEGCAYRERLKDWYRDQNIHPTKIMELGSFETILSSVAIGLGVTCVPRSSVSRQVKKGIIQCHPLPKKYSQIHTVFIRRKDSLLTTTIQKFIETIDQSKINEQIPVTL